MKDKSQNSQSRRCDEKSHQMYETYKNTEMPHRCYIYTKESDMAKARMWVYTQYNHALPNWKCVLRCCADCLYINLPDQETNRKHEERTPSIRFHIYHIIARCTAHDRIPSKETKYVTRVNKNIHMINIKKYTQEKSYL